MSDNLPANERPKTPDQYPSTERRLGAASGALWGGVALIGIGLVFLLQNIGVLPGQFNWWAFFILLPGLGMLYRALTSYQAGGVSHRLRSPLIGGIALTMIGVIFLFNLDWDLMWPVFLIMAGVALFLTAR